MLGGAPLNGLHDDGLGLGSRGLAGLVLQSLDEISRIPTCLVFEFAH